MFSNISCPGFQTNEIPPDGYNKKRWTHVNVTRLLDLNIISGFVLVLVQVPAAEIGSVPDDQVALHTVEAGEDAGHD